MLGPGPCHTNSLYLLKGAACRSCSRILMNSCQGDNRRVGAPEVAQNCCVSSQRSSFLHGFAVLFQTFTLLSASLQAVATEILWVFGAPTHQQQEDPPLNRRILFIPKAFSRVWYNFFGFPSYCAGRHRSGSALFFCCEMMPIA